MWGALQRLRLGDLMMWRVVLVVGDDYAKAVSAGMGFDLACAVARQLASEDDCDYEVERVEEIKV